MKITTELLRNIIKQEIQKMLNNDVSFKQRSHLPGREECDEIEDEDERAKCLDFHSALERDEEGQRQHDEFLRTRRP